MSVEFGLELNIIHQKEGDGPSKTAVGGLLWISGMMRPDIASAVGQWPDMPTIQPRGIGRQAVRKIIAYIKATKDLGVVLRRGGDLKLLFTNTDYTVRCNDRRSVSDVAVMLGNTAVSVGTTGFLALVSNFD